MGNLKQQKCIVPQFWRLEIYDQGMAGTVLRLKPVGDPSLSLSGFWGFASTPRHSSPFRYIPPMLRIHRAFSLHFSISSLGEW